MLFSIIIPAYNAEPYICRAIGSILSQNFLDLEVIVVNDGSTDKTLELLEKNYHANDNVLIINKENSGVSSARNCGLKKAKGEYIVFLDADDWVENGYFKYLKKIITNEACDGVVLGHIKDFGSNIKVVSNFNNENIINSSEYTELFMKGNISNNPWDKVFKKTCYLDNGVFFPENISMGEDSVVSAKLGLYSKSVYLSNSGYVHYMQNTDGVTKRDVSETSIMDLNDALSLIISSYSAYCSSSKLSHMYVVKMYSLTNKDNFKTLISSPCYSNFLNHIRNVYIKDLIDYKCFVKYYPLYFLTQIRMLPFFNTYNKIFNFLHALVSRRD